MSENIHLMKGLLKPDLMAITQSTESLEPERQDEISNSLIKKIPSYVFETPESRTLIIEDILGYSILKLFHETDKLSFIFIRAEGKLYSNDEIRKISFQVNQQLDFASKFEELWKKTQEIFIKVGTYDFSRPIKAKLFNLLISEKEKALKIDEILQRINEIKHSKELMDIMEFYKLVLLYHSKKRNLSQYEEDFSLIYKNLNEFLLHETETGLNPYETACIIFNFALMLKDLNFNELSNDAFLRATAKFKDLKIDNLEVFSIFNLILNYKQMKKYDIALTHLRRNEERVLNSEYLPNGFKGIFFRHLGELTQLKNDLSSSKIYYRKSLDFFEKDKQVTIDTAIVYLAIGTIDYKEHDYFSASKYFSLGANIFNFLNQDIGEITQNLGISFIHLSNEYLLTVKVLLIEKDFERVIDLSISGLNYLFLANLHLGNQLRDNFAQLGDSYTKVLEKIVDVCAEEEKEIAKRIIFIIKEHSDQLNQNPDSKLVKMVSKRNYEKLKEFQPIKVFYFMTIFKDNGLVLFSQTSKTLHEMPEVDENLIAGMITAISSFLEEVLQGDENLSLIDRDNIKIMLEYSDNLIGLLFVNKETPQTREDLKTILSKTEANHKEDFAGWTGEISRFADISELASKIMK